MILCLLALGLPCLIFALFVAETWAELRKLGRHSDLIVPNSTTKKK